ncbi:MAG: hypothetical protein IKC26_07885 [Clostridia bacterium]|nr:hypothetical protein [Clostridia bacterium]
MRRILAIALAALMILSVVYVGVFTVSAETTSELPANAKPINDGDDFMSMQAGGYYYLAADITIDFSYSKNFTGTLDGQGHTITTATPVFTSLNGATIRNLIIDGDIDDTEYENVYVGALANSAGNGLIENVHNKANVLGYKKANVGGLVGFNRGGTDLTIINCSNSGDVTGVRVAGIVAHSDGENILIKGCTNSGNLNRTSGNNGAGGILATISNNNAVLHIDDCVNSGDIVAGRPGGIVGDTSVKELVITDCVNTGDITSPSNYAGGIGSRPESRTRAVYRNCINTGTVTAFQSHCGGIVAYSSDSTASYDGFHSFYGCVNVGTVQLMNYETETKGINLGGIAGKIYGRGEFYNCVSAGNLYGTTTVAGIVCHVGGGGYGSHVFSGCYVGGTIYSTGINTSPTSRGPAGLVCYAYSSTIVKDCVVAADITSKYDLEATTDSNIYTMSGFVGYSNSTGTYAKNNYFLGTLNGGKNVLKVICIDSRGADMTAKVGTNLGQIYSVAPYPLYTNIAEGPNNKTGIPINKADYTPEKIAETINGAIGYEAMTVLTAADANEYGLVGILPTSAVKGAVDPSAEALPIGTAEEFLAMKPTGNYYLTADITLPSSYKGVFGGVLDGKGYTLTVSNPVFEVVSGASISDLTIKGTIKAEGTERTRTMNDYRGALANAGLDTVVTNVTNDASVTAYYVAGGIFAHMQGGKLVECVNNGTITANTYFGGLVGEAVDQRVAFEKCVNNGTLRRNAGTGSYAGGLVGYVFYTDASFTDCVNNAALDVSSPNTAVGGILGYATAPVFTTETVNGTSTARQKKLLVADITMTNCVNNGKITAYGYAGGLIAWAEATVTMVDCVNTADVASVQSYAGGLACYIGTTIVNPEALHTFENCVNNGDVTAHRLYAGGIVAQCNDNITFESCVNEADVTGEDITFAKRCKDYKPYYCHNNNNYRYIIAGGIVARTGLDTKLSRCVSIGDVSGNCRVGGLAGEIGYAATKGIDGAHEFIRCYVEGDIYNANLYYTADTAYMNGTGGLFGTASNAITGSITVQYCGVNADVTGIAVAINAPCAVGGLGGYCNTAEAFYLDNYFAGNLFDGGYGFGVRSLIVYSSSTLLRAANAKGNFSSTDSIVYYHDARGLTELPKDNYVTSDGVAAGELCYRLYESCGRDVFFQQLGVDEVPTPFEGAKKYMVRYDKTVPEYYNISHPSEERPDPTESESVETDPIVTDPIVTDPIVTDPIVTDPVVTDPSTEPVTEPVTEPSTEPVTDPVTDPSTEPTEEGGCGSVIGASLAIAAVALIAPAAVLLKKRDEE